MIFGMTPILFVHVAISLVGIASGFVVIWGLLVARRLDGWTAVFLATTVATSVTGFFLPAEQLLPSHVVGIISLAVLAVAIVARYQRRMAGGWRRTYVIMAVAAQYLNFFVLVVQSFQKVPALHELAPTQSEPPFAIAQLIALVAFVVLGVLAAKRFRVEAA
jgi:hypothetical protein